MLLHGNTFSSSHCCIVFHCMNIFIHSVGDEHWVVSVWVYHENFCSSGKHTYRLLLVLASF